MMPAANPIDLQRTDGEGLQTTKHVVTGAPTTPQACFEQTLSRGREERVALLGLVGDILSFLLKPPSSGAARLQVWPCLILDIAGHHDWHYEGLEGTSTSPPNLDDAPPCAPVSGTPSTDGGN
jgi:hypothetical protein